VTVKLLKLLLAALSLIPNYQQVTQLYIEHKYTLSLPRQRNDSPNLKEKVRWPLYAQYRYLELGGYYDAEPDRHLHIWRTNPYCGLCSDSVCHY
jgi:hypothetical protein